jgi:exodeoxyribonuclease-3
MDEREDALRIATFNICGWRSAAKKGLLKWIEEKRIDLLAAQELRTMDVAAPLNPLVEDYSFYFNPSSFHGTAIIAKEKPLNIMRKIGYERFDKEGRFIQAEFEAFTFINAYMPHGGRDKSNLPYKLEAYQILISYLHKLLSQSRKPIILAGDLNVAHKEVDLARPKENENNTMFTKEERQQIDQIVGLGFIDAYRKVHPKNGYTWWLRGFNAKEKNIGWRIDYIFISKQLEPLIKNASIPNLEISDHCPVVIEITRHSSIKRK